MKNKTLSPQEEEIGKAIVNSAFLVQKELGPGLLEKVYEVCAKIFFCILSFAPLSLRGKEIFTRENVMYFVSLHTDMAEAAPCLPQPDPER